MLAGIFGLLVGIFLIVRVIETTNFSGVPALLLRFGAWAIVAILIPYTVAALLDAETWRRLLILGGIGVTHGARITYEKMLRIRTATEAIVITLPLGSILSDPFKAWMLRREFGLPISKSAGSIVLRKALLSLTQCLVALSVAFFAILYPEDFSSPAFGSAKIWTIFILASIVALFYGVLTALFCSSRFVAKLHAWLGKIPFHRLQQWFERKEPQFHEFNADLRALRGVRPILGATAAYTFIWIFENVETLIILALLGANLTIPQALLMEVTCVLLRSSTPMVPGGIGVQDTGYVSILMGAGNSGSLAAAFLVIKRSREALWALIGYVLIALSRKKAVKEGDADSTPTLEGLITLAHEKVN
jgi:glycosyltransferase 2 family protein